MILAVDPGSNQSAWLVLDGDRIHDLGLWPNQAVLEAVRGYPDEWVPLVIETIEPWAGVVGPAALETMFWVGRFVETRQGDVTLLKRSKVLPALGIPKLPKGKAQAAVRAELIDRWGGGNPVRRDHPLHGIRDDLWSALALAVAYQEGLRP